MNNPNRFLCTLLAGIILFFSAMVSGQPCSDYTCDSLRVRAILDANSLTAVTVQQASSQNSGRIDTVFFTGRGMTVLPAAFGDLTALKYAYLEDNAFTSVPSEVGQQADLEALFLTNNQLTSLPDSLKYCTNLYGLLAEGNNFTAFPAVIQRIPSLVYLYLDWNQIPSLPDSIGNLTNLEYFSLHANQLTSLPNAIGKLSNMVHFAVDSNQVTSVPDSLQYCTALQWLYLDHNQLTGLPANIGNLSVLEMLTAGYNQLASLPASIGGLSSLIYLYLENNQLTSLPDTIGNLLNLDYLVVRYNQLAALPSTIGNLTALQRLYSQGNLLTGLPASIGDLSGLQELYLFSNQLAGLPGSMGKLSGLHVLEINSNRLTDLPDSITYLDSLTVFNLNNNYLCHLSSAKEAWVNANSSYANWLTTQNCITAPVAAFLATALAKDSVILNWDTTGQSADLKHFLIRYNVSAGPTPDYPAGPSAGTLVDSFPPTVTTARLGGREENRYYWYSIWAVDTAGNASTAKNDSAHTPANQAPAVLSPALDTAQETQAYLYAASASDPDHDPYTISFDHLPSWLLAVDSTASGTCPYGAGDTSFLVIASDGSLACTLSVALTVEASTRIEARHQQSFFSAAWEPLLFAGPVPAQKYMEPVTFRLRTEKAVTGALAVYDLFGMSVYHQDVSAPAGGEAGAALCTWDLRNGRGTAVAAGGYVAVLRLQEQPGGQIKKFYVKLAVTE